MAAAARRFLPCAARRGVIHMRVMCGEVFCFGAKQTILRTTPLTTEWNRPLTASAAFAARLRRPLAGASALLLLCAAALSPVAAAMPAPAVPEAAGDIAPHRAAYRLSLHSARNSSKISDVRGMMTFEWADACDGWTTEQRFQLNFVYAEGAADEMITSYATWEAKDGTAYRFSVRKLVNGETDEEVRGDARYPQPGGDGVVSYVKPEPRQETLPRETMFPSAHTIAVLGRAAAGDKFYSRIVFDGTDDQGPSQVSAVIAKPADLTSKLVSPLLKSDRVWPVRMAFFSLSSDAAQPDYEMTIRLLGNGVAEGMRIDYGDFVVDAVLEKLEALGKSGC